MKYVCVFFLMETAIQTATGSPMSRQVEVYRNRTGVPQGPAASFAPSPSMFPNRAFRGESNRNERGQHNKVFASGLSMHAAADLSKRARGDDVNIEYESI